MKALRAHGRRRPHRSTRRGLRLLPIGVGVLLAVLASGVANREAAQVAERAGVLEAVLGTIEADLAVSHIRVEELVAGDQTVDVDTDIVRNQTKAATLCRTLREGGRTSRGRVDPVDDATAVRLVARVSRRVDVFRGLTESRLVAPREVRRAGSAAETRYDAAFASFLAAADSARARFEVIGRQQRRRMQAIQALIVLVLSSLVVAAGVVIRRREAQLVAAARDYEAVLHSTGEGIVALDRTGIVQYVNGVAAAVLGWRPTALVGQSINELLPEDGDEGLPTWLDVDRPEKGEDRRLVRADGSAFPVAYTVSPTGQRHESGWIVVSFENIADRLLEQSRRDAELAELRAIKETLVPPEIPERPGLELATCYEPAQSGVAGDFYLVVEGPAESTVIVVGDVAGKGVGAARRAAYARATLANFAAYAEGPRQLLEMGNRAVIDAMGVSERFITATCVMVQPSRRAITWASAGHPPPLRLDDGTVLSSPPSLPLGLRDSLGVEQQTLQLAPGGGLLLYTDGLSEARRSDVDDPELLGMPRVAAEIRAQADAPPDEVAARLHDVVAEHSHGKLADDLCMIALRFTAEARPAEVPDAPLAVSALDR